MRGVFSVIVKQPMTTSGRMRSVTMQFEPRIALTSFLPGQCVSFHHSDIPTLTQYKYFSAVSPAADVITNNEVSVMIDSECSSFEKIAHVTSSASSPLKLEFTQPHDVWDPRDAYRPLLLVCGGVGISSIVSILRTALEETECPHVFLLASFRRRRDMALPNSYPTLGQLCETHRGRFTAQIHLTREATDNTRQRNVVLRNHRIGGGDVRRVLKHMGEASVFVSCPAALHDVVGRGLLQSGCQSSLIHNIKW